MLVVKRWYRSTKVKPACCFILILYSCCTEFDQDTWCRLAKLRPPLHYSQTTTLIISRQSLRWHILHVYLATATLAPATNNRRQRVYEFMNIKYKYTYRWTRVLRVEDNSQWTSVHKARFQLLACVARWTQQSIKIAVWVSRDNAGQQLVESIA